MTESDRRPWLLATRGSSLARAQAGWVAQQVERISGREVQLVIVESKGDRNAAPLTEIGGEGVFVAAVRCAVREGRADLAVHSLKDLPTAPDAALHVAAVPRREDPRDVVCAGGRGLGDLPAGARVGTGSPRRAALLVGRRPDVEAVPIRGNVDTRLSRVNADLDAVILAAAGLRRLGRTELDDADALDPTQWLPAPGQGALAVETGATADPDLLGALAELDHPHSRAATEAERAVLAGIEGGCSAPMGAYAWVNDTGELHLVAGVFGAGRTLVRGGSGPWSDSAALGESVAQALLAAGAGEILGEVSR